MEDSVEIVSFSSSFVFLVCNTVADTHVLSKYLLRELIKDTFSSQHSLLSAMYVIIDVNCYD